MNSDKNNINKQVKNENDVEELRLDDIELKDVSFDVDVKPDNFSATSSEGSISNYGIENSSENSIASDSSIASSTNSSLDSSVENLDTSAQEELITNSETINNDNQVESISDINQDYDDRSIKEKVQDLKNDIQDAKEDLKEGVQQAKEDLAKAKENIQNLPENIRKKKEDIKRKTEKAKENIQNLPENARKKTQDVKDRAKQLKDDIQNFPKNKEELASAVKDRLKKTAKKAKEKARDTANKALEKGKENLKDRIENSKPVKAAKKAKKAYQNTKKAINRAKKIVKNTKRAIKLATKVAKAAAKAAQKAVQAISKLIQVIIEASPWSEIIILIVLVLVLLIMVIVAVFKPGGEDVNLEGQEDKYSETDLKTLEKLRKLYEKYPNADAALAMVTVIYPYYDSLQSGDMKIYMDITDKDWDPEKTYNDYTDLSDDSYEDSEEEEDEEDIDVEEDEENIEDDIYLDLYRKWKYRRKFKKLLKKLNSMTEDEFFEYLKEDYFESESGYKYLYSFVDDENKEAFTEEIINDLKEEKSYFLDYIYNLVICTNSSTTLNYSYAGDIIQGEAVVVLKDSSSGDFDKIKSAPTLYGTDDLSLSLKRYVMGVAYAEIGGGIKKEAEAKAVMITAKSFVLGRTAPGSSKEGDIGMGFKTDQKDGKTIFYMRGSTADQDFCDVYEGCNEGSRYAKNLQKHSYNGENLRNTKGPLEAEVLSNLEKWYDETASEFVYDDEKEAFAGNQYADYGTSSSCKVGSCLSQTKAASLADQGKDYQEILYGNQGAFSDDRFKKYDMETKTLSKETSVCEAVSSEGACGLPDDKFIYYSQDDPKWGNNTFCGRTEEKCGKDNSSTISEAACGVTSMAMVIANLTNQTSITPLDTMNEAQSGGYCGCKIRGTSAGYFKTAATKYGLTYKSLTVDSQGINDAIEILKSGGLIIANVGSASPFTTGGHYVVIRKIDGEGYVYVADPKHSELFGEAYNINKFVTENWITNGWWGFTSNKSEEIIENYCKTINEAGVATGTFIRPIDGNKQCNSYPWYSSGKWHGGGDIPTDEGTPVLAADGGVVETVKYLSYSYGHHVVINHGNGFKSWYGHMSTISVKKGDKVSQGQEIGKSGNTGNSTGPHLHFEVRKSPYKYGASYIGNYLNPCEYIGTNKKYVN